jgi:hypothetical protein
MNYDRVLELYQSGEIGGVIGRVARGKYPDVRFPEFHAELGVRGVPLAGYGVFSPYNVVADQVETFKKMEAKYPLVSVGPIKRAGDVEIALSGMSQTVYASLLFQYLSGIAADTIYSAKFIWQQLVGNKADGWHGAYQKWAANYTAASSPALPDGWVGYLLWQYSETGNGAYYGVGSFSVDLNRWSPDFIPPDPDPIPDPQPSAFTLTAQVQNQSVRTGPSTTYPKVDALAEGADYAVYDVEVEGAYRVWARLSPVDQPPKWAAIVHNATVYLK